jgi:hypothetical protein
VAVNVAVVLPAPTVTEAGTVNAAVLLDRATTPPPVFDTVTVHIELTPDPRLVGLHDSELTAVALASATDAVCVLPFNAAVTVAVWSAAIVPAVAVNVAVLDPAATTTDPGTVSAAVLLDSVTVPPLVFDSVTVHMLVRPVLSEPGVQLKPVNIGSTGVVTVPPVPVMDNASPSRVAPSVLVTPTVVLVTPAAIVTVTTATTPF